MQNMFRTETELDPVSLLPCLPSVHFSNGHQTKLLNVLTLFARRNTILVSGIHYYKGFSLQLP